MALELSSRRPGEGRDLSFHRFGRSNNGDGNGLPTLVALVPRRNGPRLRWGDEGNFRG